MFTRQKTLMFTLLITLITFTVFIGSSICTAQKVSLSVAINEVDVRGRTIIDRAVQEYEKRYPNVDVEITAMSNEVYQAEGLRSLFATGQPPDVYMFFGGDGQIRQYVETGRAIAFDQYLLSEKNWEGDKMWKESFIPSALQSGRMEVEKEKLYEVPRTVNISASWYNTDVFKKVGVAPPTTWTEWGEICQRIKNAGYIPIVMGNKGRWHAGHWFAIAIQRMAGKEAYFDLVLQRKSFTDPDIVKAFSLIGDFAQRGFIVEGVNALARDAALPLLFTGKAAMEASSGSWHITSALDYPEYNFDFFKVPKVEGGKGNWRVDLANKHGWLINAETKHLEEAIDFVRAQSSFERGKELAEIGQISAITGTEEFLHPLATEMVREIFYPAPDFIVYADDCYEEEYGLFIEDAFAEVIGGRPVEETLARIQKRAEPYQNLPK